MEPNRIHLGSPGLPQGQPSTLDLPAIARGGAFAIGSPPFAADALPAIGAADAVGLAAPDELRQRLVGRHDITSTGLTPAGWSRPSPEK